MSPSEPTANRGSDDVQEDVIILRGRELKINVAYVAQMSLRFFAENPRIFISLAGGRVGADAVRNFRRAK